MDNGVVFFEDWERVLRAEVPLELQRGYREAIVKFRYWLREKGRSADVATFKEHLAWLKTLFAEDRKNNLPGVWLPEGLERKYARAGEKWEWQWLWPSRETVKDPVSDVYRRHHVQDGTFQNAIREACAAA